MMKEEWRPVRGKEEWAEISNYGLIHYYGTGRGKYAHERFTYGYECGDYLYATIGGVHKGVHVWVYMTFYDCDIPKGLEVNHIDEDKHNNRLDNLNLMTPKENTRWGTGIARHAAKLRGKPKSPEHKAKLSVALRGRKRPAEVGAKISAANKNNPKKSKPVQALDPKTLEVVYEFPSTQEAGRQGFDQGSISHCCLGKIKKYKGYIWRYAV